MMIINFGHPLTEKNKQQIAEKTGEKGFEIINVKVQLDQEKPFVPQIIALVEEINLTSELWQSGLLLINLPAFHVAAGLLLAELNGRMGHFPPVMRLRPTTSSLTQEYELAEILNLQAVRDEARKKRF